MIKKTILNFSMLLMSVVAMAQRPDLIPGESEPMEITPFNIILYIVLPILMIIGYLWWRNSKKKK